MGLHLVGPTASADPPLFHAAVLQSGAPIAVGSAVNGQVYYDAIVEGVGCSGSAQEPPEGNAAASLECLRQVDWREIKRAVATTPGVFDCESPRFLTASRTALTLLEYPATDQSLHLAWLLGRGSRSRRGMCSSGVNMPSCVDRRRWECRGLAH